MHLISERMERKNSGSPHGCRQALRNGFTLIELMIAAFVLVILFSGVYKIYTSVARTQQIGTWMMGATTSLRNGLSLVRDEIAHATVPKQMTQLGVEDVPGSDPYKKFKTIGGITVATPGDFPDPTKGKTFTDFSATKDLIKFYMAKAGRKGIPGEVDVPIEIMEGTLRIKGGKIEYERSAISQSSTPTKRQVICDDPLSIRIEMKQIDAGTVLSAKNKHTLFISITAKHPKFPKTFVTESIAAPFEVDPNEGSL